MSQAVAWRAGGGHPGRELLVDLAQVFFVHVIFFIMLVFGTLDWRWRSPPRPALDLAVRIVDSAPLDAAAAAQRQIERERAEQAARQAAEHERRKRELEAQQQREQEAARQRATELERQREREAKLRREQVLAEARRREEEARRRAAETELARQRELEKLRAERQALEKTAREQAERLARDAAAREAERQAAERAAAAAAAQQAATEAAEAQAVATLTDRYIAAITAQVTSNWLRPPTARPGLRCRMRVVQIPGGEVISATPIAPCNADEATRRSIVNAVLRSGELPYRGFESVFQREIDFTFVYDG